MGFEFILKMLSGSALYGFLALGLTKGGIALKNKDANTTGADDCAGDILLALAPAIASLEGSNENARRKALKVARDSIDGYLNQPASAR